MPYLTNIINKIPMWKLFLLTLMEKLQAKKSLSKEHTKKILAQGKK